MARIPNSPLLSIVALGVACFSTGFSVTAAAYTSHPADTAGSAPALRGEVAPAGGRTCEQPAAARPRAAAAK